MLLLFPWFSLFPDRQAPLHFCFITVDNGLCDNRGTDNSPANGDGLYCLRSDMFSIFFLCIPCLFISAYQHQSSLIMNQYTLYSQYTIILLLNSLVVLFSALSFYFHFYFNFFFFIFIFCHPSKANPYINYLCKVGIRRHSRNSIKSGRLFNHNRRVRIIISGQQKFIWIYTGFITYTKLYCALDRGSDPRLRNKIIRYRAGRHQDSIIAMILDCN